MRHFLLLCLIVAGSGCSSDSGDESSKQPPQPVLIKYSDSELRGKARVQVKEDGEVMLTLDARNEQEQIELGLFWSYKWSGSVSDLRSEMMLRPEDGKPGYGGASLAIGDDAPLSSKGGVVHAALENGVVSGDFTVEFEGHTRMGTFSGKPSLSCEPLNDGSDETDQGAGAAPADGGVPTPSKWRSDPNLESEFCRNTRSVLGL